MHFTSLALFLSAPLAVLATPVPANDIVIAKTDNTVVDQPLLQGAAPSANTKRDVDALVPDDFIDAEAPEHEAHRLVARAPSYQSLVLTHHNVHRSNHSASAMGSNYAMAVYAYQWASQCNFAHNTSIGGGGYGQNLYAGTNSVTDAITSAWYNGEVNNFKSTYYGQATPDLSNFGGYGHVSPRASTLPHTMLNFHASSPRSFGRAPPLSDGTQNSTNSSRGARR